MILESGMKVLVTHRRLYENDHNRYFTGIVEGYENGLARVTGNTWVRHAFSGDFKRKEDLRTKIISLASGTLIVYQLPSSVDVDQLTFDVDAAKVHLTDGKDFYMDLTECVLHAGGLTPGVAL